MISMREMARRKKGIEAICQMAKAMRLVSTVRFQQLRDWAETLLNEKAIREQGILNADVVKKIWSDFTEKGEWRIQIWFILMFQQWMVTQQL